MAVERKPYNVFKIKNKKQLEGVERREYGKRQGYEALPWASNGTSLVEVAETIIKDKDGSWVHPLYLISSMHNTLVGSKELCKKTESFLKAEKSVCDFDTLSIYSSLEGGELRLLIIIRAYKENKLPSVKKLLKKLKEELGEEIIDENKEGALLTPEELERFNYSSEEIEDHNNAIIAQNEVYKSSSEDKPFLNSIDRYTPQELPTPEDTLELVYDLKTKDQRTKTRTTYEQFTSVFRAVMSWVSGIERYNYITVLMKDQKESQFLSYVENHVIEQYVNTNLLEMEDVPAMMEKLYRALFQMYIIQDLIDDPKVTDIKITGYDAIRARIDGKAYITNITFVDEADYERFIEMICIRNGVQQNIPAQTFTDTTDENYIIRFSLVSDYVTSESCPYLHIRKIRRKKLMSEELLGVMFDEKVRDYLIDCGKNSRGVVFAGPPGSGKTVCLNWFLEDAYEPSAEILVIQENDELFAYRKGVMFEHVVNYGNNGTEPVSLEKLGQLALVAGANVFVIGEAKGGEICSAITLSNSGCRTALTIHSPSANETIDKMADLAMRGYAENYEQAKRMIKSFQTIVYLENFQVKEISEIVGYDEEKKDMIYRCIYRREEERGAA